MTDVDPIKQQVLDVIAKRWPEVDPRRLDIFWHLLKRPTTMAEAAAFVDLAIFRHVVLEGEVFDANPDVKHRDQDSTNSKLVNLFVTALTQKFCASSAADNYKMLAAVVQNSYDEVYRSLHDGREPSQLKQMRTMMKQAMEQVTARSSAAPDTGYKN